MAIVALAAADCLALRWFYVRGSRFNWLILGLLPVIDLLSVGVLLGGRDLIARRRCSSFLVGFQAFGWAVAAAYTLVCVSPSAFAESYFGIVLSPVDLLIGRLGGVYDDSPIGWRVFADACTSAALSAPLLAGALVGGRLARRFEIWLARGAWLRSGAGCPARVASPGAAVGPARRGGLW
jgi:hypothetical protein